MRVLLVDDERDTADMIAILVSAAGHDVRTAYDGLTALEIAETFGPQIAIIDINMPGMKGNVVAQHLRKRSSGGGLQLVSLTGRGDRGLAFAACFDHHLVKPVTARALLQTIAAAQQEAKDSAARRWP